MNLRQIDSQIPREAGCGAELIYPATTHNMAKRYVLCAYSNFWISIETTLMLYYIYNQLLKDDYNNNSTIY